MRWKPVRRPDARSAAARPAVGSPATTSVAASLLPALTAAMLPALAPGAALPSLSAFLAPAGLAAQERAPAVGAPEAAESGRGLTVARIFGSPELLAEGFEGQWTEDGRGWTVVEPDAAGRDELWRVDAVTGERERLVTASELRRGAGLGPPTIFEHAFSPDGRYLLIFTDAERVWRTYTRGRYYVFDLERRRLEPVSRKPGLQMFAKFGPDSRRVAFVRDHDLHLVDLATGEERALTTSGSEDVLNGSTDWVYEEELGLRDAFRWSPDGTRIAYWQFDRSPIRPFHLLDELQLYPELRTVHYPKAGTENSEVRVGSLELSTGRTTWLDVDGEVGEPEYIARMEWVDEGTLAVQTLNRHQDRLEIRLADAATGRSRSLLVETDPAWVDVDDDYRWSEDGERLVWSSRRDGWNHLYLVSREGEEPRQITSGDWDVTALYGLDGARGRVWFQAGHPRPTTRSVGWVPLEGGEVRWVAGPAASGEGGMAGADPAPDFGLFVEERSALGRPPVHTLRDARGEAVRVVEGNAVLAAKLDSLPPVTMEFLRVTAADGRTELNGWVIRPPGFDSTRTYPLLLYVYGGPGIQTVLDGWGGARGLWHRLMAERGFVVASVDNRGTGARGRDFYRQTYRRLGILESDDQLAALRQLAAEPWIDGDRTGLWGWSYGGYLTLMTTLRSAGTVAAAASVAPVTHWELYDTIYTERYMQTPAENPLGYRRGSPRNLAARLESALLLVHGTGDDNVHAQNTLQMVQALVEANRPFELALYPNRTHAIGDPPARVHLFGRLTGFFERELGAE